MILIELRQAAPLSLNSALFMKLSSTVYEAYFNSATESLIVLDRHGRVLDANPQTERLFSYSRNELLGQPIGIALPAPLREQDRAGDDGLRKAPGGHRGGIRLNLAARRKDGSEFPVGVSLTHISDESCWVAAITDLTEHLAAEGPVREVESTISLRASLAGLAHDLNNLFCMILARAELARAELLLAARDDLGHLRLETDLAAIDRYAQRASRAVRKFLSFRKYNHKLPPTANVERGGERALLMSGAKADSRQSRGLLRPKHP